MGTCVYLHMCICTCMRTQVYIDITHAHVAIIDAGLDQGSPTSQVVKFRLRSSDLHSRTTGAWGQKLQQRFRLKVRTTQYKALKP